MRSLAGSAIVSVIVCRGSELSRDRGAWCLLSNRYRVLVGGCRRDEKGMSWSVRCLCMSREGPVES
jgi:hypothetical protein